MNSVQPYLRQGIVCLFLLIGLSSTACEQKKPASLPLLFEDDVILAFGDSITYGTGASAQTSYPTVLQSLSGVKVVNAGIPGDTTAGGLSRLPETLDKHKPALVLLCLGGNDFLRKVNGEQTRMNLNRMLDILQQRSIPVVLIAVPRLGIALNPHPLYESIARERKVLLVEDLLSDILGNRGLKADPIHPNAKGYKLIAEAMYKTLKDGGAL